jgi:nucleolar protein 6
MVLFAKKFGKFMMKKGFHARRKKSSSKYKKEGRRCFNCGSKDHLVAQCPYNSEQSDDDKKSKKKEKKEKKAKKEKKGKKGGSYVVTWDSDASSSNDEDSSDDDKSTKKKGHASIAINEKPSLFNTPSCFMAKATKVQTNDESDSESDDDDAEPTKDELMDMLEDAKEHFNIKRKECKDLTKEVIALRKALGELQASHESLKGRP